MHQVASFMKLFFCFDQNEGWKPRAIKEIKGQRVSVANSFSFANSGGKYERNVKKGDRCQIIIQADVTRNLPGADVLVLFLSTQGETAPHQSVTFYVGNP